MDDFDYYWEKAEFQDPVAHRNHVENYKKGIRDSLAFDEQYQKEAEKELNLADEKVKATVDSLCGPSKEEIDKIVNDFCTKHADDFCFAKMEFECRIDGDTLAKLTGANTEGMLFDITYASPRRVQVRRHKKKRINKKWAKRYGYKTVLVEHELTNCTITHTGIHTDQVLGTLVR